MIVFLFNGLLALLWVAVSGAFTLPNLLFGFVLGALALVLVRAETGRPGYGLRLWRILVLGAVFLRELALSAWRVGLLVAQPQIAVHPGIVAVPLRVTSDLEITLLANLVTLTPGTLSVDVAADRRTLFIHALDARDPGAIRAEIADGFERLILEAFAR